METNGNIEKLRSLIKDIRIAMLCTMAGDGMRARPMATQTVEFDGDLWFMTKAQSGKEREIDTDPRVAVIYEDAGRNLFVSVSGEARVLNDREKVAELWSEAYEIWFPEGKDDPSIRLIKVRADKADYWDGPEGTVAQLVGFAAAYVTGDASKVQGESGTVDLRP